jgi:hypothetical protein
MQHAKLMSATTNGVSFGFSFEYTILLSFAVYKYRKKEKLDVKMSGLPPQIFI